MFWLGEYANILLMCAMGSILFLGRMVANYGHLSIKYYSCSYLDDIKNIISFYYFALIKAIVPRYRYDQLMRLGWKIFLPFSLIYLSIDCKFFILF